MFASMRQDFFSNVYIAFPCLKYPYKIAHHMGRDKYRVKVIVTRFKKKI